MKSYLSLVPICARMHRRQNRMTNLCIVFAVFLVTGIFSMAEMGIRMETARLIEKHGMASLLSLADSAAAQNYFLIAAMLFVLILIAGILMISGSIGMNVAQRTKFFGMLRCIGMSRRQVIRFVRLEALNWCKTAIPVGVALGIVCSWALCAVLRFLVGEEFTAIPLFGVSIVGICSGILVGIVTVLIAAGAPARRAASVPPIAALSGNSESVAATGRSANTRLYKVDIAIGIRHATERKKNLFLIAGSFALSILLFLTFSVLIDLVNCMMPQSSAAASISISAPNGSNSVDKNLPVKLQSMAGVLRVYGRRNLSDVPASVRKGDFHADAVDLVSYDAFDLDCLTKDHALKRGGSAKSVYGNSRFALLIADTDTPLTVGDSVRVGTEALTIAGILQYNPFTTDGGSDGKITLITSAETFARLTGITDYSLVLIQTTKDVTDADVASLRLALGEGCTLRDMRDRQTGNTYTAFVFCVYGFLSVIALITALHIINSISMGANARIRQYGAMRAVGMDTRQVARMIAAEAAVYAISGCAVGCAAGLLLSKLITDAWITSHFPYAKWEFPAASLAVILLLVIAAVFVAVYLPVRQISRTSITEAINEL